MLVAILAHPSDVPVQEDFFTQRGHSLLMGPPHLLLPVLKEWTPDIVFADPELVSASLLEHCAPKTRIALLIHGTSPEYLERLLRGMPVDAGPDDLPPDDELAGVRPESLASLRSRLKAQRAQMKALRSRSRLLRRQLRQACREYQRLLQSIPAEAAQSQNEIVAAQIVRAS